MFTKISITVSPNHPKHLAACGKHTIVLPLQGDNNGVKLEILSHFESVSDAQNKRWWEHCILKKSCTKNNCDENSIELVLVFGEEQRNEGSSNQYKWCFWMLKTSTGYRPNNRVCSKPFKWQPQVTLNIQTSRTSIFCVLRHGTDGSWSAPRELLRKFDIWLEIIPCNNSVHVGYIWSEWVSNSRVQES